jgi:hypothetical protein
LAISFLASLPRLGRIRKVDKVAKEQANALIESVRRLVARFGSEALRL